MKKFQKNKNIAKKGYIISNSKTCELIGHGTSYFNIFKEVEEYTELFSFYNTSNESAKNNNFQKTNITLVRDSFNKSSDKEMCLSLGLGQLQRAYLNPEPPHFVDDLYKNRKITRSYWTLKFTEQNEGYLIIGDFPHEYENDTNKYFESNYKEVYTESYLQFFHIWELSMKDIYFYNSTGYRFLVNNNNNRLTFIYNFGFIIGSNQYRELIYENYFEELIDKSICKLELSEKTKYNSSEYFISTNGSYLMFICEKKEMSKYIQNFPSLHFTHVEYRYLFNLTYKDLFMAVNDYYYFRVIFPYNNDDVNDINSKQYWFMGLPFLRQYQFVFNSNEKRIGFYKTKNFPDEEDNENRDETDDDKGKKIIIKKDIGCMHYKYCLLYY